MISELGSLLIAALLIFGIYKLLIALLNALPDSSFRTFLLSTSGRVLVGFISFLGFWLLLAFVLVGILGINC